MANNDRFYYEYEYNIELFLPRSKEPIKPLKVKLVEKESDYGTQFYPILRIVAIWDKKNIYDIHKNQHGIIVKIQQISFKFLASETDKTGQKPEMVERKVVSDENFLPLFDASSFPQDMRKEEFENDNHTTGDKNNGFTKPSLAMQIPLDMILYNIKDLAMNKDNLFNAVFKGCDVGTALTFIIDQVLTNGVIVDPPENTITNDYIILLPYNLRNTLHSLHIHYGIYKKGLLVFMDVNRLYILNRFATSHEFEQGDKPYNTIECLDAIQSGTLPSLIGETNDAFVYSLTTPVLNIDPNVLSGEVEGNKVIFTSFANTVNTIQTQDGNVTGYNPAAESIERPSKGHEKSGTKVTFDYDELNNPYLFSSWHYERAPRKIINITIEGVNVASLQPNKIFKVKFPKEASKEKDLGGNYTPIKIYEIFHPLSADSNKMTCNASINLMSTKE